MVAIILIALVFGGIVLLPITWLAFIRPRGWRSQQLAAWRPALEPFGGTLKEAPPNNMIIIIMSMLAMPLYPLWKRLEPKSRLLLGVAKVNGVEVTVIPSASRVYDVTFTEKFAGARSDNSYRTYVQAQVAGGAARPPVCIMGSASGDTSALTAEQKRLVDALGANYITRGPREVVIELEKIVDNPETLKRAVELAASLAA